MTKKTTTLHSNKRNLHDIRESSIFCAPLALCGYLCFASFSVVFCATRCGLPVKCVLYSRCSWVPSSRSRWEEVPLPPVLAATNR